MEKKEFKVGDWVSLKMGDFQAVGIITEKAELGYVVKANNSYFQYVLEEYMERIDAKTAFLCDLSELLRKYDAKIDASWDEHFDDSYPKIDLDITFDGQVEGICFENVLDLSLTPDNIFNYDK